MALHFSNFSNIWQNRQPWHSSKLAHTLANVLHPNVTCHRQNSYQSTSHTAIHVHHHNKKFYLCLSSFRRCEIFIYQIRCNNFHIRILLHLILRSHACKDFKVMTAFTLVIFLFTQSQMKFGEKTSHAFKFRKSPSKVREHASIYIVYDWVHCCTD